MTGLPPQSWLLLAACLLLAVPTRERPVDGQREAEKMAASWWSSWYRGVDDYGAAWVDGECYVGVCGGRSKLPGKGGEVRGRPGEWYNDQWEAKHRTHDGEFYKNTSWFGRGPTWQAAFADAVNRGYPPMVGVKPNGGVNEAGLERFLRELK